MKKILVVKALNNSEWDCVDVALVSLDTELIDSIKEAKKVIDSIPENFSFNDLTVFNSCFDFKVENDDCENLLGDEDYLIVNEENELNLDSLDSPESAIDCQMICFSKYSFNFKAYGKHTCEEFWTESISYSALDI